MFVDSHCHLTFPELAAELPAIRQAMAAAQVDRALCICTTLEEFDAVHGLALQYDNFWATVGVHPDSEDVHEPSEDELVQAGALDRVVAIGETGLDYYQMEERKGGRSIADMEWQRQRFRTHIRAARRASLPLVIHTRAASDDTLAILKEEGGGTGVFHCFAETREVAQAALGLRAPVAVGGDFDRAKGVGLDARGGHAEISGKTVERGLDLGGAKGNVRKREGDSG